MEQVGKKLVWQRRYDMDRIDHDLKELPDGPQALSHRWSLKRRPQMAAVLSTDAETLYAGVEDHLSEVYQGLLVFAKGYIQLGLSQTPNQRLFAAVPQEQEGERVTATLPLADRAIQATMEVWLPQVDRFLVPADVRVSEPVPISEVPASNLLAPPH